ncbi:MAG: PQQ-binding-like beta-propeller repeat protein, partial [Gemmatimonadaceae bacterium]
MKTLCGVPMLLLAVGCSGSGASQRIDWGSTSGDPGAMRYAPIEDINPGTVSRLQVAWTWNTGERAVPAGPGQLPSRPGLFQASPVVIGDTMYVSTPYAAVAALDARTGVALWKYDPEIWRAGQPSNGTGFVHRGVATWATPTERRIFINARWRLIALDAATGKPIPSFGENGEIDLVKDLRRPVNKLHYTNTSPPMVYGDLVIVGNGVGDRLRYRNGPPGDVQAFDVRTGKRVWSFHTIPDTGEFGVETWEEKSYAHMGHTNVWAPMSLDVARGLLFLPVGTPTNDWYGGDRKGDNLFAESVVALNAKTGERVWHYQIVHHGLWDYDLPAPPVLATITWNGQPRDVVAVPSKTAWIYVFDRETGEPVWPIVEQPVPASDVPGERTAPTQPIPSNPPPFTRQEVTEDDLIDFTPELKRRALEVFAKYRSGPIFTPPSMRGTITMPGSIGGAGWGSTSYDPETHILYVKGTNNPVVYRIQKGVPNDTIGYEYTADLVNSGLGVTADPDSGKADHSPPQQLPLIKPP